MSTDPTPVSGPDTALLREGAVALDLADLLPDSGGEIVVRMSGMDTLTVTTDRAVASTGTVEAHVTASGENVAGYRFYQLDDGLTLYCASEASLLFGV